MQITESALEEVLNLLVEKFPNRLPTKSVSLETLNRLVGNQQVIDFLVAQLEVVGSKSNGRK